MAALALALLALSPAAVAADGAPDRTFGSGGFLSLAPARFSSPNGVVIDAQGRMLIGATLEDGTMMHTQAAVLRLLPDGTLDPAFGSGGVAAVPPPAPYRTTTGEAFAVDAQGRMVIAGEVGDDIPAVMRLLPDGTLDPSFASGGILVARGAYDGAAAWWRNVALSGSGIVVAGAAVNAPSVEGRDTSAALARIDDNGVPDPTFGSGGFLELPIPGVTHASSHALAIDGRGRLVLGIWRATTADFPGDVSAAIVRLGPTGALDATFGIGGLVQLGALRGSPPLINLTRGGDIVALGAWGAHGGGGTTIAVRLLPNGRLDPLFGTGGEVAAVGGSPANGMLDCRGNLVTLAGDGVKRFGRDGRLDPTFHGAFVSHVPVGDTTGLATFGQFAFTSAGRLVVAGWAADGPSVVGGTTPVGHSVLAVGRVAAGCPIIDVRPPTVTLTCAASCRIVQGSALDDPVGRGIRRVLLGVERIAGEHCAAWDGRRFAALPCGRAATRLIAVRAPRGVFRAPALGAGRFVVRAVAIDGAGNRSRLAVRRVSR
jgi:uncharacterized delta-60 repeat protein